MAKCVLHGEVSLNHIFLVESYFTVAGVKKIVRYIEVLLCARE